MLERRLIWATPNQRGFPPPMADGSRIIPGAEQGPRRSYNTGGPAASQAMAGPSRSQALSNLSASQVSASQVVSRKGMTPEQMRKHQAAAAAQQEALRKAAELKSMLNTLEKVDDESRRSSLLDNLCSTADVLQLPEHPNPPGIASGELIVNLLKHQVLRRLLLVLFLFSNPSLDIEPRFTVVYRSRIPQTSGERVGQTSTILAIQKEWL